METKNLEKAMEIVASLIACEPISEKGSNSAYYQDYSYNSEVNEIVQTALKKMNLAVYEYNNSLFVCALENNKVFGYSNEELKKAIGVRLNKELYLCYFIIYNTIMEFYSDSASYTYAEFTRVEDVMNNVDASISGIVDKSAGVILDEIEENSFKQIAMSWDELPAISDDENSGVRAARNSKSGYVKMVFNFLVQQELFVESQARFYPTDRFKALIENYYDGFGARLAQILNSKEDADNATD